MSNSDLKDRIRALTRWIGEARGSGDGTVLEALRRHRLRLACLLAREHGEWTLVNPEGHTEFVPREEYVRRMQAWMARQSDRPRAELN